MNNRNSPARHLRTFYLLTVTQVLSLMGSMMTYTVVGIRVFNDTGESTPLLMASFFAALPLMIGGLFAGAGRISFLGKTLAAPVHGSVLQANNRCTTMQADRPRDGGLERCETRPQSEMRPTRTEGCI